MPTKKKEPTPEVFKVSHSKMAAFRRCLQRYQWNYVDKYFSPPGEGQMRGLVGHAALAVWHSTYDAEQALAAAQREYELQVGVLNDDWVTMELTLTRYFDWSRQNDTFKVVSSEQEFNIAFEFDDAEQNFTLNGYIDGLVEEKGTMWILENKFYKRADNTPLDLDAQVSIYVLAASLLGYEVQGVIYNIVRMAGSKVSEKEPVIRRRLHRSSTGLELVEREIADQVRMMRSYHKGELPTFRNPTKDCHWDCAFYDACLMLSLDGRKPTFMLERISHTRGASNGNQSSEKVSE
jgi:PD-(D/E)XK nuclease superfamily